MEVRFALSLCKDFLIEIHHDYQTVVANQLCAEGLTPPKYAIKFFIYWAGHEAQTGEQEMHREFWWESF
jgi:hypothetical protein